MLSIQHILHSLYTYDMTYLHRYGASVVYPDAIRAYTNGSRKYSHFEHVFRDKYYYMVFPLSMDAPRKIIEEHIKEVKEEIEAEIPSEFQSEILKPCAIGEDTSLTLFCKTNTDLPEKMYTGIVTHLKQDIAFDKFIRMHIDCSKKLRDKFVFQERKMDGSGVRRLITEIEQYGIYALAFLIFKEKGILCNQSWLSERIKPILDRDYSADLSDTTFSYMKIDTKIEQYITNQDWSHLDDGPITFSEYKNFYDDLSEYITEFQATPFYSTAEQKQDMDLFIQKLECINYTTKISTSSYYNTYNVNLIHDLEKVFNHLGGVQQTSWDSYETMRYIEKSGQIKNVRFRYFTVNFFKKGTAHITFTDENLDMLKKFNIFGSQQKGWLPPSYGKKAYNDMTPEEKSVVNEFQGENDYRYILEHADQFIYDPKSSVPLLTQIS